LADAFRLLESEGLEDVPVVDPADARRILGMVSRADLIAAYNRTVATLGELPVSAWLTAGASRWAEDFRVVSIRVPASWVGRSLREIDCRARCGVPVLAVAHDRRHRRGY